MAEREPQTFDQAAIAKTLGAESLPVADPAFGKGWHFQVNDEETPLSLETFPDAGVTRIATKTARVELFDASTPVVEEEGIVYLRSRSAHDRTSVTLHPNGIVTLGLMVEETPLPFDPQEPEEAIRYYAAEVDREDTTPPGPPSVTTAEDAVMAPAAQKPARTQFATPPEKKPARPVDQPSVQAVEMLAHPRGGEAPVLTTPRAEEDPLATARRVRQADQAPQVDTAAPQADNEEEPERVKVTGRLGRNPTIRETAGGKLVAKFPLALHNDDGTTTWRDVLAFGDRAAALKKRVEAGELVKGKEVDVVGYLHEREYQGRDGTAKTAQEIYSVAITKR
ncbi:single-stranded DNA-binding protein [Kitasatospora sp. NPDC094028]